MVKDRIRTLMEKRGWKVNQLAFHADVSDTSIYNIFNGADPKLSMLARLAKAFNVPICDLIDESQREEFIEGRKINEDGPDSESLSNNPLNAGPSSHVRFSPVAATTI